MVRQVVQVLMRLGRAEKEPVRGRTSLGMANQDADEQSMRNGAFNPTLDGVVGRTIRADGV
jgi:hypothetical protein